LSDISLIFETKIAMKFINPFYINSSILNYPEYLTFFHIYFFVELTISVSFLFEQCASRFIKMEKKNYRKTI